MKVGTGRQHWSTVHVADLADFFRRVLEDDFARGRYVIGNGANSLADESRHGSYRKRGARDRPPGAARAGRGSAFWLSAGV
jgi:hypothetical protein